MGDRMLNDKELAEQLNGVDVTTLERWRRLKEGPAYIKVGRQVRYRQSDVDRWLEERTVRTESA